MGLSSYFLIIIVLVGVAILAERELHRRREDTDGEGLAITNQIYDGTSRLVGAVRETGDKLVTPEYVKLIPDFRQWIADTMDERDTTRRWLLSLSDEGFKALMGQLMLFCYELNFDLAWLLRHELDTQPEVKRVLQEIVIDYCQSCLKAMNIQSQLLDFREYQEMLNQLEQRNRRDLRLRLLNELRDADLAKMATPDLIWASDRERRQFALESIRYAAEKDREEFDRIWKSVMSDAS